MKNLKKQQNIGIEFKNILESIFYQIELKKNFNICTMNNKILLNKKMAIVFPPAHCNKICCTEKRALSQGDYKLCEECEKLRNDNPIIVPILKDSDIESKTHRTIFKPIAKVFEFFHFINYMKNNKPPKQ